MSPLVSIESEGHSQPLSNLSRFLQQVCMPSPIMSKSVCIAPTRVFVVDDERLITDLLASRLERYGAMVEVYHNGEDALSAAIADPPDLIVTDLQMPYMDGLELLSRLSSNSATENIPVVLLTASGRDISLETHPNIKAIAGKPFCVADIVSKSVAIISGRSGVPS